MEENLGLKDDTIGLTFFIILLIRVYIGCGFVKEVGHGHINEYKAMVYN